MALEILDLPNLNMMIFQFASYKRLPEGRYPKMPLDTREISYTIYYQDHIPLDYTIYYQDITYTIRLYHILPRYYIYH